MTGGLVPVLGASAFTDELFEDIAIILLVSAIAGLVALKLRQPLVVAFVVVGVLVGPSVLGIVGPGDELELFAELGVAILLFVVGLKLDLHVVRRLGPVAVLVGSVQVAVIAAAGFLLALGLGLDLVAAIYVGIGLSFSSTIIVVKLLSDRRTIEDLHGRLAVGILIVQDIVVVLVLIVVATTGESSGSLASAALTVALQSAALLVVVAVLMRWVLEPLLHSLARSSELLLLFAIAWAVALAAAGEIVGIGTEVGAFLAGFSLASTPYREAIGSRLVSVRDFLLLFFFIDLGSRLEVGEAQDELLAALVLSVFVLVVKPLVIAVLLAAMRYRSRISLEAGVTLAQISEFSLILAALGLSVDHIDEETTTLLTVIALVTITVSSYLFLNSETIARMVAPMLERLERPGAARGGEEEGAPPPEVVVLGIGRFGHRVVSGLTERGVEVLGVDFDPVALSRWAERGTRVLYGDVEDPELPATLPLPVSGWVVSTVRHADANVALLHALRDHGYEGKVAVAAHHDEDAERLREAGADRVLLPYAFAAEEVVELVAPPG
ncbi:MAG TPA: cation:proton antiporter [Gaiellaceae bacterium]|nr:cation:proton antiporter [Gaiellaceae bacterium]